MLHRSLSSNATVRPSVRRLIALEAK